MANPENIQQTVPKSAEAPGKLPNPLHEDFESQKTDLANFRKEFFETQKNNAETINLFESLDNPTTKNITKLRRGGIELSENEKDTLKKHTRLSSAFLEATEDTDKISFRVNFKENETANRYVGAGDLLPANVESIKVLDDYGNVISAKAVRNINNRHRIGYYDAKTGEYVPIHTGFKIVILNTRTDSSRNLPTKNSASFQADPVLTRRKMREHIGLFENTQPNTTSEDLHIGLNKTTPVSATRKEIKENNLPESKSKQPAKKEITSKPQLELQGYKIQKSVNPKVTRAAVKCLKKGGPLGTTFYAEINGKRYAFHREKHIHPSSHCPPLPQRLCGYHHGISVYKAN